LRIILYPADTFIRKNVCEENFYVKTRYSKN